MVVVVVVVVVVVNFDGVHNVFLVLYDARRSSLGAAAKFVFRYEWQFPHGEKIHIFPADNREKQEIV